MFCLCCLFLIWIVLSLHGLLYFHINFRIVVISSLEGCHWKSMSRKIWQICGLYAYLFKKYDDVGKKKVEIILLFLYLWYCSCLKLVKERFWSRVNTLCLSQVALTTAFLHGSDIIIGTPNWVCEVRSNVTWRCLFTSLAEGKKHFEAWGDFSSFFSCLICPLPSHHSITHGQRFRFWFKWAAACHNDDHLDGLAPVFDNSLHKTMLCFLPFLS